MVNDETLHCPHCGTPLLIRESPVTRQEGDHLLWGVLGCECCAYPVVDGIPVVIANDTARAALAAMEDGRPEEALRGCLGLDEVRWAQFQALRTRGNATYRECLAVLSPDDEGTYFLYRFSDPTYITAETILRTLAQVPDLFDGPVLDVCGGSGHLTRVLASVATGPVYLADYFFFKLWLARTFTVPGVRAVCCDANQPVPFARRHFVATLLSDAFPYIWQRRLLATELLRATSQHGTLLMPHLHSSLGWNHTAGMALTPEAYADLFVPADPRLFSDEALFDQAVEGRWLDLAGHRAPAELDSVNAVTLIASAHPEIFTGRPVAPLPGIRGELRVNPLYTVRRDGNLSRCTLTFPSEEYADEFGQARRYLPETWETPVPLDGPLDPAAFGDQLPRLRQQRVLLDLPARYC